MTHTYLLSLPRYLLEGLLCAPTASPLFDDNSKDFTVRIMDRFTQPPPFPGDESQPTSISWQMNGPVLPVDVSVLSWAALLHSFTNNEISVFTLNGLPVKVDLSASKVHDIALDTGLDVSESYTAVVIEDAPEALSQILSTSREQPQFSGLCVLSLNLDSQTGAGALHSSIGIDAAILQQIGRQLKQFIYRQAKLNGLLHISPFQILRIS